MPTTPATVPVSTPKKRGRKPLVREPESRPDLTKEEMREKLIGIKEIESVTGIRYIRLHVTAKMIIGIRESSGKEFTINLDELYKAYTQCNHFHKSGGKEVHLHGTFTGLSSAQISEKWINYKRTEISNKSKKRKNEKQKKC